MVQVGNITTRQFVAGSRIYLEFNVFDDTKDPPQLVDPVNIIITLKNPAGTIIINAQAMTRVRKGVYSYTYQSQSNDTVGYWSGTVTTSDGAGIVGISLPNPNLFLIVAPA